MNQDFSSKDIGLILTHYGEEYSNYYNAITPPVFMNSLNIFDSIDSLAEHRRDNRDEYVYSRVSNPTCRILEDKIAALEHGTRAFSFGSGMAAASTAVLTTIKQGSHIVCVRNAYGPLADMLRGYCREHLNVDTTFVSGEDIADFEKAVTDRTDLIILESPSSAIFSVQDLKKVSEIARKHHAITYIDNSYCTPIFQNPLDFGIDIVMHTMTKYIGGHSDLLGGILVVKDQKLAEEFDLKHEMFGGILGPAEAWLAIRGLRTLEVRMHQHNETALAVSKFLEGHNKVRRVMYPGLPSHPQHQLIQEQQRGSSGLLSFEIDGTPEQAKKLASRLKVFKIGVSWGGFESLVCMPFGKMEEAEALKMGADRNLLRIHCGLEGTSNLVADLDQALLQI